MYKLATIFYMNCLFPLALIYGIRETTSISVKFSFYFTLKAYFFYFTHPFLQNTHISLFILPSILFNNHFSLFLLIYLKLSLSTHETPIPDSSKTPLYSNKLTKLLSIPTNSLLSETPFYSKLLSEIPIQAWCRSIPSELRPKHADPSTPIQARRSKHIDLSTPIQAL